MEHSYLAAMIDCDKSKTAIIDCQTLRKTLALGKALENFSDCTIFAVDYIGDMEIAEIIGRYQNAKVYQIRRAGRTAAVEIYKILTEGKPFPPILRVNKRNELIPA